MTGAGVSSGVRRDGTGMMASVVPDLWFVRHGATEWSETGRHTGRTDVPLSAQGRAQAESLRTGLAGQNFATVLTSPLSRARDTATLAGFPDAEPVDDLQEWDYGALEGLTSEQIRARGPEWLQWTIFAGDVPGGENIDQVATRARAVLGRANAAAGPVLLFSHGHFLRVFAAVALGFPPHAGAQFALETATINVIGTEHIARALRRWNEPPPTGA
jgi:probable phosphoglycerate mutase